MVVNVGSLLISWSKNYSFENKCLRLILNIKWSDFKTNDQVRKTSRQEYISNIKKDVGRT
jgi:hypothetical protein